MNGEKGQEKEEQNPLIEAISQKIKAKTFLEKLSEAEPDLLKNYSTLKNDLMRYEKENQEHLKEINTILDKFDENLEKILKERK